MTSRERVIQALEFKDFDRVPLEIGTELGITCFESDVGYPAFSYGIGSSLGTPYTKGMHTDFWGCLFEAGTDGVLGEVKSPMLYEWSLLDSFKPPIEVLSHADLSGVSKECQTSDKFMIHMWGTAPFQRIQFLRGSENVFMDLAVGNKEIFKLLEMVHEFYMTEVEMWANTDINAIHIEDDWGAQFAMLISPEMWREYFKPLYNDYCEIARKYDKYIIMHSDGHIMPIIDDLIEIGVHAINAQLDCMNVPELARLHHGKVAFWGGFDRQYLLPRGTEEEVRAEVRRIGNEFFQYGKTGVIGQCYLDRGGKIENLKAVYDEWLKF